MLYLTMSATLTDSVLKNDYSEDDPIELLPRELIAELHEWNKKYRNYIIISNYEREYKKHEMKKLDEEGLKLLDKIKLSIKEKVKIKYFSEGELKFLVFS